MATNPLAPTGLSFVRLFNSAAGNYATTQRTIQNGYGSILVPGEPVSLNSSGYVVQALTTGTITAPTNMLGIFAGVLPYYDTNTQQTMHGLNGEYITAAAPPTGTNIQCQVIEDFQATFAVQTNSQTAGGFQQSWVGMNCTWVSASANAPNAAGKSTLLIDNVTNVIAVTTGYPFKIIGPFGTTGSPQDPANLNPWIEVRFNAPSTAWLNYTPIGL
jgi:hypothetical protein